MRPIHENLKNRKENKNKSIPPNISLYVYIPSIII